MMRTFTVILILATVLSFCGVVCGMEFMGPPFSYTEKGKFGISGDVSYSKWDLDIDGSIVNNRDATLEKVDGLRFYVGVGYGLFESVDIYGRIGAADLDINSERIIYNADYDLAWVIGGRWTFHEEDMWKFGLLAQYSMLDSEDNEGRARGVTSDVDLELTEAQVALGVGYDFGGCIVYGGPFLYYADGEMDADTVTGRQFSGDIEQDSAVGGVIGALFEMNYDARGIFEWGATPSGWLLGASLVFRF